MLEVDLPSKEKCGNGHGANGLGTHTLLFASWGNPNHSRHL